MNEKKYEICVFIEQDGKYTYLAAFGADTLKAHNNNYHSDYGITAIEYENINHSIKYALVIESMAKRYLKEAGYDQEKYLCRVAKEVPLIDYKELIGIIDPNNEYQNEREAALNNRFSKDLSNVIANANKKKLNITISTKLENENG